MYFDSKSMNMSHGNFYQKPQNYMQSNKARNQSHKRQECEITSALKKVKSSLLDLSSVNAALLRGKRELYKCKKTQ